MSAQVMELASETRIAQLQAWLQRLAQTGFFPVEAKDTGLRACLPYILAALGWRGSARELADALPYGRGALLGPDLLKIMEIFGYRVQREKRQLGTLMDIELPALFFPQKSEVILLLRREAESFRAYLPADDQNIILPASEMPGILLRFERIGAAERETNESLLGTRHWFRQSLSSFSSLFWHAGFISLLVHIVTLAVPIYVMLVYDRVINARSGDTLIFLFGGAVIALVFEGGLRSMRTQIIAWFGARISTMVNAAIFERLMLLSPTYAEQAPVSAQLARIKAFEAVRDFFTGPMFQTILEFPFTIVLILAIALIAGPVAWVPVAVILGYIVLAFCFRPHWRERSQVAAHTASERQQMVMETTRKLALLRYGAVTKRWKEKFTVASLKAASAHYAFLRTTATIEHLSYFMTVLGGVGTILFGIERIWAGEMTPGALVATMIITWRVLYPLQIAHSMLPYLEQVWQSIDQVNQLMLLKPERNFATAVLANHAFRGDVIFTQVGLRYGRQTDPVLAGIGFHLQKGEHLAIYGANGTGKSTVLKLAARMHTPQVGSIRIDGIDLRQMDPSHIRRSVSYLPQVPEFFSGSLMENLRLHAPFATDAEMQDALEQSHAAEEVASLADGLHTRIGPGERALPAGLAARLNLARFYIDLQPILLIDELPYALLNSEAGERFRHFLQQQKGLRTALFVTHREDFAALGDKLLWLQQDRRAFLTTPDQWNAQERIA